MPSSDDEELEGRRQVLEVEQRQVVVVAVLEDQREDRGLGVVEVQDLAEQQRPERVDRRPDLGAELARQRQELDRVAGRLERPGQRGDALHDLRVGRVAGRREAGQVALDVGDEDRHAGLRELAGEELEGLGLAGPGGARDEPVAVEHRQRDLHARVVDELAVVHRAADDEARLGRARSRPPSRRGTPGPWVLRDARSGSVGGEVARVSSGLTPRQVGRRTIGGTIDEAWKRSRASARSRPRSSPLAGDRHRATPARAGRQAGRPGRHREGDRDQHGARSSSGSTTST